MAKSISLLGSRETHSRLGVGCLDLQKATSVSSWSFASWTSSAWSWPGLSWRTWEPEAWPVWTFDLLVTSHASTPGRQNPLFQTWLLTFCNDTACSKVSAEHSPKPYTVNPINPVLNAVWKNSMQTVEDGGLEAIHYRISLPTNTTTCIVYD